MAGGTGGFDDKPGRRYRKATELLAFARVQEFARFGYMSGRD